MREFLCAYGKKHKNAKLVKIGTRGVLVPPKLIV
jgi:hypothetical protein